MEATHIAEGRLLKAPDPAAPTPPVGPTTVASLTTMLAGMIIAGLSLFHVAVDAGQQANIGVLVGGAVTLGALAITAISRTKQATALAGHANTITTAEINRSSWDAPAESVELGPLVEQLRDLVDALTPSQDDGAAADAAAPYELLGMPKDPSLEVPAGSQPTSGDQPPNTIAWHGTGGASASGVVQ
jgi:hypothetical protein